VTSIDKAAWQKELELHAELFQQLEHHLPKELGETKAAIERAWLPDDAFSGYLFHT
jgi:phosphoenolpyruvate carboxykinase (GTP)